MLYGIFYESVYPICAACATDFFPNSGTVLGIWTLGHGIAGLFSSLVAGYLADISATFYWSFTFSAFFSTVALIPIFLLKVQKVEKNKG